MNNPATIAAEIGTDPRAIVERDTDLDALSKVGQDAIDRGNCLTHDELIAELGIWRHDHKRPDS